MGKFPHSFFKRFQNPKKLLVICVLLTVAFEGIFLWVNPEKRPFQKATVDRQTIQWHRWQLETFEKAKSQGKPLLIQMGYSTCFYCRLMDEKVRAQPKLVAFINQHYIAVKIDREIDIGPEYFLLEWVSAMGGQIGFPLHLVLTPTGDFLGSGTFFEPKPFRLFLKKLKKDFQKGLGTQKRLPSKTLAHTSARPVSEMLKFADDAFSKNADIFYGGIGQHPKFAPSKHLQYALKRQDQGHVVFPQRWVDTTLLAMLRGGFFDPIDGGFFRYSLDAQWKVPSFEKNVIEQALLAETYAMAFQKSGNKLYEKTLRMTLDFAIEHLSGKDQLFFHSLVGKNLAFTDGHDFLWEKEEITPYLMLFNFIKPDHFKGTRGLIFVNEIDTLLTKDFDQATLNLKAIRKNRGEFYLNDTTFTFANGLMIAALARAGKVLGSKTYLEKSKSLARAVKVNLMTDADLKPWKRHGVLGEVASLDDHAFFIYGLIQLYECSGEKIWLQWAGQLQKLQDAHFWDENQGGYFLTREKDPFFNTRRKVFFDEARPSGNGVALQNLLALSRHTTNQDYLTRAKKLWRAAAPSVSEKPLASAQLLNAATEFLD